MNARSNEESTQHAEGESQDVSLQDGRLKMLGEGENERQLRLVLYVAYRMMKNISGPSEKLMWSEGDQKPMPNETEKERPVPHWACLRGPRRYEARRRLTRRDLFFGRFLTQGGLTLAMNEPQYISRRWYKVLFY